MLFRTFPQDVCTSLASQCGRKCAKIVGAVRLNQIRRGC